MRAHKFVDFVHPQNEFGPIVKDLNSKSNHLYQWMDSPYPTKSGPTPFECQKLTNEEISIMVM